MPRQSECELVARDAAAIVTDDHTLDAAGFQAHFDARGAGVEAVFDQFLDDRRRALDDFAGGDLADQVVGQQSNRRGGEGRCHGADYRKQIGIRQVGADIPSRMIRAPLRPPDLLSARTMEGINWLDLFNAMDRFLVTIVERNVLLVYVMLFAIYFSETGLVFMAFLPGDSLLFVAGAVSALPQVQAKGLNVYLLMTIITLGAVLGNTLNYMIGAWLGKKVYDGTISWIDQAALKKTHDFYERHGGKTVMIARFVPIVRSFAPLVAGASGMDMRKFQLYSILGAVIWVVSLVFGGYLFGNVPIIKDNLGVILIVGIAAAAGPMMLAAPGQTAARSPHDLTFWSIRSAGCARAAGSSRSSA